MDEIIKLRISNSLKTIGNKNGIDFDFLADSVDIPHNTLRNYIRTRNMPPLIKVIGICNRFNYSINDFFGDLVTADTEQQFISQIKKDYKKVPDIKKSQLSQILEPIMLDVQKQRSKFPLAKFGARCRILREESNISLESMAKQCKLEEKSLKVIESRKSLPGIDTFLMFCNALHASPEYLLCNHLTYISDDRSRSSLYSMTLCQLASLSETIQRFISLMS